MQQGEPSLEEILASIRKIMTRDERVPVASQDVGPAEEEVAGGETGAGETAPKEVSAEDAASEDASAAEVAVEDASVEDVESAEGFAEAEPAETATDEGEAIEPASADEAEDILDLGEHMLVAEALASSEVGEAEPVASDAPAEAPPAATETPLKPDTASAVRESLAALERLMKAEAPPKSAYRFDAEFEELTKETLRPMLEEWLEDNLPTIVERLVQDEIARIVGGRR